MIIVLLSRQSLQVAVFLYSVCHVVVVVVDTMDSHDPIFKSVDSSSNVLGKVEPGSINPNMLGRWNLVPFIPAL